MTKLIEVLTNNGIAVVRTDTLYGVLGKASNQDVVERIYTVKGRDVDKPFIILISDIKQLELFGIELTDSVTKTVSQYWPGPVSIILPVTQNIQDYEYLHRGTESLAFRMPDNQRLVAVINQTGPLVAPSANPQGKTPAKNTTEARRYFKDTVDYYDDRGEVTHITASKIIRIDNGETEIIRE